MSDKKSVPTVKFMDQLLELTDLDEKAEAAVHQVEKFLETRKSNFKFVVVNFPYAAGLIGAAGVFVGIYIGLFIG